ncbi:cilia- and flagella-associated protein 337-like isoform X1 [Styela clava]
MEINSYTSISSLSDVSSSDYSFKSSDSHIRLEEHIKLHHLHKLLHQFQTHVPMRIDQNESKENEGIPLQKSKDDSSEKVRQKAGMMTLAEFKVIISSMLGTKKWNDQMEMLFYKVDTGCDGYVDWNEFCTYMLLQMRELEHIQNAKLKPFTTEAIVKRAYHNKQETTTKMLLVENPTRIVNISKVGDIGVYDTELRLLKNYKLGSNFSADDAVSRRRCHTWVTDGVYMRNAQKFALTTTSREIYFYDTSTATYYAEFCLYALPDVPNCVNFWYAENATNSHSMLLFGDDTGSVHILHFHFPQSRLFEKPFSPQQGTQRVYFNDIKEHKRYVTYEFIPNIHEEVIRRVMYVADGDVIISSSVSSSTSVVLMDLKKKKKTYIYKVNKGVECFDYSKSLNVLVTGSLDHFVRIWNPYVEAKPICLLQGHSTGICDVVINRSYAQIISYSKDAVIKVWDIKEHYCIQTITLKIPSVQPGRIPDHGEFPISLFERPHNLMLVSCNDCIALLKMGKLEPAPEAPTTHKAALCNAIYNDLFHQVVTAADDSTVTVWNVENGTRSLKFSNAHENEEITCLSFDKTYRRLFTGARDGSMKAWNFQNGNCLHEFESVTEAEVTGIMSFQDQKILAVGWSRCITLYDDSDPDIVYVTASTNWKSGQIHKDDILTMDHCDPNYLATGSYDGTIIVWNEETQQITTKLRDGSSARSAPIEKLLFLQDRFAKKYKNGAVLLSSECGIIHMWCVFGHNNLLGKFSAVEKSDLSVLGMSTSPDNSVLITGDSEGNVTVWDISNHCLCDISECVTTKPPLKYRWKAHDKSIVNVNYIDYELQGLLVTSSTDKTARLWTLEGKFVGTFGQSRKWDLKRPATFQHPRNPWGELVEDVPIIDPLPDLATEVTKSSSEQNLHELGAAEEKKEIEENKEKSEDTKQENTPIKFTLPKVDEDNDKLNQVEMATAPPQDSTRINQRRMTSHPDVSGNPRNVEKTRLKWKESRSTTIGQFQLPKEKILGEKAEKHLARRTVTRQERRYRVGYIDRNTTSRFGNLCSPFQALSIPDTKKIDFSSGLPMSQRMQDRGMACLSEKDLGKLPLSNLLEVGDESESAVGVDRQGRKLSSRRNLRHGSPRRGTFLPPITSRASSRTSASDRPVTGSRSTSSSICGSR